jgi:C-terminal processing protease CtpA/Prc
MLSNAMFTLCRKVLVCLCLKVSLCCCLILASLWVHAQWHIYSYVDQRKHAQNLLSHLPAALQQKGFVFFGNAESHLEKVQTIGYSIPLLNDTEHPVFSQYAAQRHWQAALATPLLANNKDPLYLSINLFADNIKEYFVGLHEKGGTWRVKKIECKRDRYQLPQELSVSPKLFPALNEVVTQGSFEWQIDSLAFLTIPQQSQLPSKLVLGECLAYQKQEEQRPAQANFFYDYTHNPQHKLTTHTYRQFGNQYPFAQITSFTAFGPNQYHLTYSAPVTDTAILERETLAFIAYTIKRYPYFKEHQLSKTKIVAQVDSVLQANSRFQEKLQAYRQLVAQLNDAHFYFETPVPKAGLYPLVAKNINGRIIVAGVIDPDLAATVEPGMEIIALAGTPVNQYIDSLAAYFAGDARLRGEMAVSRLFSTADGRPLAVTLKAHDGAISTAQISYAKKLALPANFRSDHFRYTTYDNRWGYLRLTRWGAGDWINFFSMGDEMAKQEGIVFDLRGNGGGQELDMMQIAACFFKRSTSLVYNTYQPLQQGQPELAGESIVKPNPYLHLQHLKVRILADARTGCASEMFIKLLQRSGANVKVVAAENTTGSYAHLVQFVLPFNIILHTNVMAHSYLNSNKETIEYTGIAPDIQVRLNSYKDLYPYEDKLLQTALSNLASERNSFTKR